MGRTLERGMLVGIGLILALLIITAVLNFYNTQRLKEDTGRVIHTLKVIELTDDVLLALVDAETGQRGFLLTGKEEFWQPYDAALRLPERAHDGAERKDQRQSRPAKPHPRAGNHYRRASGHAQRGHCLAPPQ